MFEIGVPGCAWHFVAFLTVSEYGWLVENTGLKQVSKNEKRSPMCLIIIMSTGVLAACQRGSRGRTPRLKSHLTQNQPGYATKLCIIAIPFEYDLLDGRSCILLYDVGALSFCPLL
jgi:hypothetical protein